MDQIKQLQLQYTRDTGTHKLIGIAKINNEFLHFPCCQHPWRCFDALLLYFCPYKHLKKNSQEPFPARVVPHCYLVLMAAGRESPTNMFIVPKTFKSGHHKLLMRRWSRCFFFLEVNSFNLLSLQVDQTLLILPVLLNASAVLPFSWFSRERLFSILQLICWALRYVVGHHRK